MKTIINDMAEKEFINQYCMSGGKGGDFYVTAHIKKMDDDIKITKLEYKKNVVFTLEGKERIEPTVLRFKDTNKQGILYSYQYEFAGRKFAKTYVKDEYEPEKILIQIFDFFNLYKIVKNKKSLNPSLEKIWKDYSASDISTDFRFLMGLFDEYFYYNKPLNYDKLADNRKLLAEMFIASLHFDKKKIINYKLNLDENTFELFTSKTR